MKDFKNIELVEAYLNGELGGQDREQFEQVLKQDKELSQLVESASNSIDAIKMTGHHQLKKKLQEIHNEIIHNTKTLFLPSFLKYAAIFVAVVSVSILAWYSFSESNNYSNLYSDNFKAYTNLLTVKGGNGSETQQALVNNAMYQYDLKNYEKANESFEELLSYKQNNDTILFYYGISQLGAGEYNKAIVLFNRLLEQKESLFYRFGHAKWYLALSYLNEAGELQKSEKQENQKKVIQSIERSKNLLKEIVAENGDYSDKAKKILYKLK
ncbi:MAG: hypothetical protein U9R19_00260 [Bacteroidota bacterium]|nr:hypothetical protein [Bacteroidota bacterium]